MDIFIRNISQLLTLAAKGSAVKIGPDMQDLGIITDGAVLCRGGRIAWVGRTADFSGTIPKEMTVLDGTGTVVLPGFVDAHTHAMFAGSREREFALRAAGVTYREIAEQGGGILTTLDCVRKATKKELKRSTAHYLLEMLRAGTTTAEIKSGYGLTPESENRMLEALRELKEEELTDIVPTFLGAHAVPPEYRNDTPGYVRLVVERMLPYVAEKGLAEFCDVFCERGFFGLEESERILLTAKSLGLKLKVHADELSPLGGAELAAKLGAVSADHLEQVTGRGIEALAEAGVVAVLLPGVSFFLNHGYAPARRLIDAGIPVALATDFNPGSCMSFSMPLMMTIACTQMRMSPEEALAAATINGAAALGLAASRGSIEVGKKADLLMAAIPDYRFLAYHFGVNHVRTVIKNGTVLEL
ncbi:MAG TPA: imidazolonepropionase [Bacteroidota bacterium]